MKQPKIRIKNAWLLRENASQHLHKLWADGTPPTDDEWLEKRVDSYQKEWQKYEAKILDAMTELTGLSFSQNIIDVYIAPWFNAFSDPLVIGVMREPDQFIDTLTHELIHRLLTDNTLVDMDTDLFSRWQKLFGKNHSFGTLIHIPVHAIHKAIYLDYLKEPKRLKRDIKENIDNTAEDYIKAWNYVEAHGYVDIINSIKADYK
jgi:hypothetical protein